MANVITALLVAGIATVVGIALAIGALFLMFRFFLTADAAETMTWGGLASFVFMVVLAIGASGCIRYAARTLEKLNQKPPPVS